MFRNWSRQLLTREVPAASLALYRIVFGALMTVSIIRFWLRGWIEEFYIRPTHFFPFIDSAWFHPLPAGGMYAVFFVMGLAALCILLGLFYRFSALVFFVCFTWVELLDKTNYLNHYYFISIVAFLLVCLPAGNYCSLDAWLWPRLLRKTVPAWTVNSIRLQLGLVYCFAGLAKMNADWMLQALPLRIWLPAQSHLPLIGPLLNETWVAYAFSWAGAAFDLFIPLFLVFRKTRLFAWLAVLVFHFMTGLLFNIGMFPWIMTASTLIFFSGEWHEKLLLLPAQMDSEKMPRRRIPSAIPLVLGIHFILQLLLPFRYLLYPGELFWTEKGFRFSWRVMLMEKSGYATFYVEDPRTGRRTEVSNSDFLRPYQEKMMSTQPDMIAQFGKMLAEEYRRQGIAGAKVYADVKVNLNGRGSRAFTNPAIDISEGDAHLNPNWILPSRP